jgi:hypothetical protein
MLGKVTLSRWAGQYAAVTAASKVGEASATDQTTTGQPMTMEALREQHPAASEEALRARLIAERSRGGSPVPTTLTRPEKHCSRPGPLGRKNQIETTFQIQASSDRGRA